MAANLTRDIEAGRQIKINSMAHASPTLAEAWLLLDAAGRKKAATDETTIRMFMVLDQIRDEYEILKGNSQFPAILRAELERKDKELREKDKQIEAQAKTLAEVRRILESVRVRKETVEDKS